MPDIDLTDRPFAVVTGASTGIGRELARQLAGRGYGLLITAEEHQIHDVAASIRDSGASADAVQADLRDPAGVDAVYDAIRATDRTPDVVCLNAGVGCAGPFVETDLQGHLDVVAVNVTSLVHLAHLVLRDMVDRGEGRLLVTSSVIAASPAPYISTYGASKAFVQSFAQAIRTELSGTGVTVTALQPGPTDTEWWERADMMDTRVGQMDKDDPALVARDGIDALLAGDDHVVGGTAKNHFTVAAWKLLPERIASAVNTVISKPGSGE